MTFTAEQSMTPVLQVQAAGLVVMLEAGVAATLTGAPAGEHVPMFAGSACGKGLGVNTKVSVISTIGVEIVTA